MQLTDYHAKYFAYELTKRCSSDSLEKLAGAVASAQVDLNPHQVDAALFAFNSPLSRGALLADEVGLGKTIEAGLVLSQKWAERKRRILIITPSNLRKQWYQEMAEKFFLPCAILETKSYNASIKTGNFRPFEVSNTIVICSYHFARNKAADVANAPWDLVVIDEAHRLRNVYKPSNVIANTLKLALKDLVIFVEFVLKRLRGLLLAKLQFQTIRNRCQRTGNSESRGGEQLAQHQRHEGALAGRERVEVVTP